MSVEAPWLDAPVVDDPEPWKSAPVVVSEDAPWESAPIVEDAPQSGLLTSLAAEAAKQTLYGASGAVDVIERDVRGVVEKGKPFRAEDQAQYDTIRQSINDLRDENARAEGGGGVPDPREASMFEQLRQLEEPPRAERLSGQLAEAGREAFPFYGADPEAQNIAAQVGRGAGAVLALAPGMAAGPLGLPLAAMQGASAAYGETYDQAISNGSTDEDAQKAAAQAAVKTAPALATYLVGGKLAGEAVSGLLKAAAPIVQGVGGAAGAAAANVAISTTLRALEGDDWQPTIQTLTTDALFGLLHGVGEYKTASAEVRQRAQQESARRAAIIAPETAKAVAETSSVQPQTTRTAEVAPATAAEATTPEAARPLPAERAEPVQSEPTESIRPQAEQTSAPLGEVTPARDLSKLAEEYHKAFGEVSDAAQAKEVILRGKQIVADAEAEMIDAKPARRRELERVVARVRSFDRSYIEKYDQLSSEESKAASSQRSADERAGLSEQENADFPATKEPGVEHWIYARDAKGRTTKVAGPYESAAEAHADRSRVLDTLSPTMQRDTVGLSYAKESAKPLPAPIEGAPGETAVVNGVVEPPASGAKLGPGAANIEEPVASYEARRFGERFVEDASIDPKIRDATGNRYYEVLPNRVTAKEAADLIESRGIDASEAAVRDTKNDLSHAVRSTVGQVLIKKLNEQYRSVKESNPVEADKILNRTADLAEWQMEYGTRLGQGVQSFAMWSRLSPEGFLKTFERMVDRAKVKAKKTGGEPPKDASPEVKKEITRLAGEVEAAAEGIPKTDATLALSKYMAKQLGYDPWDLPIGVYYSHILSGYNTHIVNALDTGLNVLSEIGTMALDRPSQAADILRGAIRGIGEGKSDALLALSEGRRVLDAKYAEEPGLFEGAKFGEKGGVPISEQTRTGRVFKKIAESKPAKFLNAYKYVSRLMAASDTIFYRAAEEARSAMLALREAEASGVEKSKLRETANRVLGFDRIEEFRQKARDEGYKGVKADARATELMIQSRPEGMRDAAAEYAGTSTYNHAPEGALGYVATQVGQMANRLPALKLVVPFTRIVANVTNRGLDWTPYGYKRALAGRTFGDGPMFGEARRAQLTKATAGTIGLAGLAVLNQLGAIQVHGGGPSNPDRKKQLQNAGWKPFTIQIGDTYISYAPTPLGLGLSSLGNYLDANRYQELKQKDLSTRTAYAVSRIPSTVFNQSFLSGLSGMFKALSSSSPGEQISELKKLFSRTTGAFTTPNILRDLNRIYDPSYRESNSIGEDLIRDIPVMRLTLEPTLNAYGEPAMQPGNRFFSVRKTEPEWRIVVDKNLRIPVADDTTFTEPKAGYEYQKIAGQKMKKWVSEHLSSLRTDNDDQAQESITRASQDIFSSVRGQIRSKYPNSLRQRK